MAMAEETSIIVGIPNLEANKFSIGPNPTMNGMITVNGGKDTIKEIRIYNLQGQLIETRRINMIRTQINLPAAMGTYIIDVHTSNGRYVEKVIRR
jgi:hypothetical protein